METCIISWINMQDINPEIQQMKEWYLVTSSSFFRSIMSVMVLRIWVPLPTNIIEYVIRDLEELKMYSPGLKSHSHSSIHVKGRL